MNDYYGILCVCCRRLASPNAWSRTRSETNVVATRKKMANPYASQLLVFLVTLLSVVTLVSYKSILSFDAAVLNINQDTVTPIIGS